MHIAIIGGSAAGLCAALLLARDGHRVDVIEHDELDQAEDPESAAHAAFRPRAPHLVHLHQVMPLAYRVMRERLPDVHNELIRAGAVESPLSDRMPRSLDDHSPRVGDELLAALQVRRSTFDWVLRHAASQQSRIRMIGGSPVLGLVMCGGDPPRVVGVRTGSGDRLADVVIDASGRRSRVGDWLVEAGARSPKRTTAPCGITYYSRHYRLRDGAALPEPGRISVIAPLAFLTFGAVTADRGVLSTVLCPLVTDGPLRALRHPDAFDAVLRTVPGMGAWLAAADPITPVHTMGGLHNTLVEHVVDGRPVALGLHVIGDAACATNPTLGRGLSMALRGAADLADALARHPDDPGAQALAMAAATASHVTPWFEEQLHVDAARIIEVRSVLADTQTPPPTPTGREQWSDARGLRRAAMVDPDLFRALMSLTAMLSTPEEVYGDPAVRARIRTVLDEMPDRGAVARPARKDVLAAVTGVYDDTA